VIITKTLDAGQLEGVMVLGCRRVLVASLMTLLKWKPTRMLRRGHKTGETNG
jgi:hypothetical protein